MTYQIIIDGKISQTINDKAVAYANYRAVCRDYANKPKKVELVQDDIVLNAKAPHLQLIDNNDVFSANDVFISITKSIGLSVPAIKDIIKNSDLMLTNSRIDGWFYPKDNRRFVQMYNDELSYLIPLLLAHKSQNEMGYTPNNLKSMRQALKLTQEQTAQMLGVAGGRQVRRWENGEQDMPSEKWQIFLDFYQKKLQIIHVEGKIGLSSAQTIF